MSTRSVWEEAWNRAQPRLSSLHDNLNAINSPKTRIIRVGQLDSELLDQELVRLLQEPLNKALALISTTFKAHFEPELTLLIQSTLYKLSIWNTGSSYGAKLQDLRYIVPPSSSRPLTPSGLPRHTLLIHGTLTIILPYLHTRIRSYALSSAWPDAPSSDWRRRAWDLLTSLEATHTLLGLASFLAFLWNGRFRTIADRLLKLQLVPSRRLVKRDVSYEFMNRQMVWHAFTEFLLFLLPLVSIRTIRRRLTRLAHHFSPFLAFLLPTEIHFLFGITKDAKGYGPSTKGRGKYRSLPQDQCAICAENALFNMNLSEPANAFTTLAAVSHGFSDSISPEHTSTDPVFEPPAYPLYNPYITSCGDLYCYHCIAERIMRAADDGDDELGWECLRCGERVKGADRYVVDVEVGSELSESDYEFSSDPELDTTDLSGSTGSYSESGLEDNT